jgi:hypothetical protein
MINKEELLICLDEINFDRFVSSFGSKISIEHFNIIEFLMSNGTDKIQFNRINAFAQFIFFERQSQHFGWDTHFKIDKGMESFQEFIYLFNVFIVLKVPFDVWKELVVDAIEILKEQLKEGNINCKRHSKYPDFTRKFNKILDEIIKDPEMERKYTDFLNGAL